MHPFNRSLRVLYSFPHKFGAGRISYTAWQQVAGVAAAGADVLACPASVHKPVRATKVTTRPTLARGKFRIPYRLIGNWRAYLLHDWIVARRLEKLAGQIDIVHAWPLGALETLKTARRLGIRTVLERPNSHTGYAFEVVREECSRLGITLPPGYEHAFTAERLEREEQEYQLADALLCPSDFVVKTFLDKGFDAGKLVRHQYGYDPKIYFPVANPRENNRGLTMLFAGLCAVRKGLHFALEAWLASPASQHGRFLIAGEFLPAYAKKLAPMLSHPSVHVLGHREDVAELMRGSDILVLPSIEEGSALATSEARGSGCVLLVSEASGAICRDLENALVHRVGDVGTLTDHITMLHEDRALLERLRAASLATAPSITWSVAGVKLVEAYRKVAKRYDTNAAVTESHSSNRENQSSSGNQANSQASDEINMTLLVSVIIPTYNRAEIVCRAINSALSQTYAKREVIVVDDGSTDHTADTLAAYGDQICIVRQENSGPSVARNRGIALAKGDIVAFLDSDDYWLPGKLARQVELLQLAGESVSCCLCNCTIVYPDGRRSSSFKVSGTTPNRSEGLWLNPAEVLSTRFILFNQAVAIRRAALDRVGYFDESLLFAEDHELALRLALQGPWIIMRDELTVCHAANPDSLGERALREETRFREGLIRMWQRMLSIVEADPSHAGLRRTMRRQVRRVKRDLMKARLRESNSRVALLAAQSLRFGDRVWDGLIRRSPFYPRPLVSELS